MKLNLSNLALIAASVAAFFLGRCTMQPQYEASKPEVVTIEKYVYDTLIVDRYYPAPQPDVAMRTLYLKTQAERDSYRKQLMNRILKNQEIRDSLASALAQLNDQPLPVGVGGVGVAVGGEIEKTVEERLPILRYVGDSVVVNPAGSSFKFAWSIPVLGELYDNPSFGFVWTEKETNTTTTLIEKSKNRRRAWLIGVDVRQSFDASPLEWSPTVGRRWGRVYARGSVWFDRSPNLPTAAGVGIGLEL